MIALHEHGTYQQVCSKGTWSKPGPPVRLHGNVEWAFEANVRSENPCFSERPFFCREAWHWGVLKDTTSWTAYRVDSISHSLHLSHRSQVTGSGCAPPCFDR